MFSKLSTFWQLFVALCLSLVGIGMNAIAATLYRLQRGEAQALSWLALVLIIISGLFSLHSLFRPRRIIGLSIIAIFVALVAFLYSFFVGLDMGA